MLAKDKLVQWKAICDAGTKPTVCDAWTDKEEQKLQQFLTGKVTLAYTRLGQCQDF